MRTPRRRKPRTGTGPLPSRSAVTTAAPQLTEMPSWLGRRRHAWPSAVKVTGVSASARERRSRSALAAAGVSPPTSTPATRTPSGRVAGEPENASPRAIATRAIAPTATATRRHRSCRGLRRLRVCEGDRLRAKARIVAAAVFSLASLRSRSGLAPCGARYWLAATRSFASMRCSCAVRQGRTADETLLSVVASEDEELDTARDVELDSGDVRGEVG